MAGVPLSGTQRRVAQSEHDRARPRDPDAAFQMVDAGSEAAGACPALSAALMLAAVSVSGRARWNRSIGMAVPGVVPRGPGGSLRAAGLGGPGP